jgi:hypothetical protein
MPLYKQHDEFEIHGASVQSRKPVMVSTLEGPRYEERRQEQAMEQQRKKRTGNRIQTIWIVY